MKAHRECLLAASEWLARCQDLQGTEAYAGHLLAAATLRATSFEHAPDASDVEADRRAVVAYALKRLTREVSRLESPKFHPGAVPLEVLRTVLQQAAVRITEKVVKGAHCEKETEW